MQDSEGRWLLLIHQIPPKPDYFRVKIWRRLQRLGAVAIKNSVYVLPKNEQTQEDFQWVLREIVEGGGEATLCEARFVDGLSDGEVEALFQTARSADYDEIAVEARRLAATSVPKSKIKDDRSAQIETDLAKLTPAQEVELYRIVPPAQALAMKKAGKYTYYRLGISPNGVWQYFLQ